MFIKMDCSSFFFHFVYSPHPGRIGQSKKALKMIMSQENSVSEAIDYCHERNDDDLWEQLIKNAINKPNFIKAILENSGMGINVEKFIRRIITGTVIPGLKDSLVTLLINNEVIGTGSVCLWILCAALISETEQLDQRIPDRQVERHFPVDPKPIPVLDEADHL